MERGVTTPDSLLSDLGDAEDKTPDSAISDRSDSSLGKTWHDYIIMKNKNMHDSAG
jgi:hypothetical protein